MEITTKRNDMNKKNIIAHAVAIIVGIILGLWVSHCTRKPIETIKVERDTVVVYDTIPDIAPKAKDSAVVKYVTKFLSVVKTDTIHHFAEVSKMIHDTVAVEVPITSKHYGNDLYDAWVSGYEPSLDSIKVYNETQYITETITRMKPPNKWELDAVGGIYYNVSTQRYTPHIGGELIYKPSRLQLGIRGGVSRTEKTEPYVGAVIKYRLL